MYLITYHTISNMSINHHQNAISRQYRAYEDLLEPCSLSLTPTQISVYYQMKSIICPWPWSQIANLKTLHLTETNHRQSNQLRIKLQPSAPPPLVKIYRFESRAILDEFLGEAMRRKLLKRVVKKRFLMRPSVKYIPVISSEADN